MFKTILFLTLTAFGAFTATAIWQGGISGILGAITDSLGSMQIFIDLVIALSLIMVWMWHDAKQKKRNVWPWLVLTLLAGSFGPLLYLLTGPTKQGGHQA